jgi:hypothetical protein
LNINFDAIEIENVLSAGSARRSSLSLSEEDRRLVWSSKVITPVLKGANGTLLKKYPVSKSGYYLLRCPEACFATLHFNYEFSVCQ